MKISLIESKISKISSKNDNYNLKLKKIRTPKKRKDFNKMKLTSKGRSAVTSLVDMAINSTGNRPISLSEISQRQNISLAFLEQILLH